jgi:hypothetical protein
VADTIDGKIKFIFSFDITNSGSHAGSEIAQLYIYQTNIEIRPFKELKGFSKEQLNPGETKTVTIELDENAFAYFKTDLNCFGVDQADFQLLIGSSSRDIRLQQNIHINQSHVLTEVSEPKDFNSGFRVYPSPAGNLLFFETSGNLTGSILSIYDVNGRKEDEFKITGQVYNYNSSKLENGIYICKLVSNRGVLTKKILIKH